MYIEKNGSFQPWRGEPINDVRYPRDIGEKWSDADLEAMGLWRDDMISAADPVPEGKVVVSRAIHNVDGVVKWVHELADAPEPVIIAEMVDAERDRRITDGFNFGGKIYQSRPEDRENISGAALAALAAQIGGALADDLRWHGGESDFVWIAADNSLTPMDAQTMFAFGQAAMAHKQAHIFAARALKDAAPIPADFADDIHWPS